MGTGVKVEVLVGVKVGVAVTATRIMTAPFRGAPVTMTGRPVSPFMPVTSLFPAKFA